MSNATADIGQFGYVSSETAAAFAVAYFGIAILIVTCQVIFARYRHWWMISVAVAALGETIGWAARLWGHFSPLNWLAYTIQICSLVVTPTLISAADYVLFCRIIEKFEKNVFGLPNMVYWIFFVSCDLISLAIQTAGAVEVSEPPEPAAAIQHGEHVLRSGIIFQFSNTVAFAVLVLLVLLLRWQTSDNMLRVAGWKLLTAMSISTLMLLIRNGYRIAELGAGLGGSLMNAENYLIGFDMVPMAIAVTIFINFPPSIYLSNSKDRSVIEQSEVEMETAPAFHIAKSGRRLRERTQD